VTSLKQDAVDTIRLGAVVGLCCCCGVVQGRGPVQALPLADMQLCDGVEVVGVWAWCARFSQVGAGVLGHLHPVGTSASCCCWCQSSVAMPAPRELQRSQSPWHVLSGWLGCCTMPQHTLETCWCSARHTSRPSMQLQLLRT
jgi:hypothetical protein